MSAYPRVRGVVFASGVDRSDAINAVADRHGLPPRLLVALADAESGFREDAARWGEGDDVSFGPYQQTVRWARIGDGSLSPENVARVRDRYTQDFAFATDQAARQLIVPWRAHADPVDVLSRYNKPATGLPEGDPRRTRYRQAWERSVAYAVPATPEEVSTMPEYQLGFLELADRLGRDVVGEPVEDEHKLVAEGVGNDPTVQATTKGLMYYAPGAPAHFFEAVSA